MSMKSWAEREVEIACKYENPDRKEGEWDYGYACSAAVLSDLPGHSRHREGNYTWMTSN